MGAIRRLSARAESRPPGRRQGFVQQTAEAEERVRRGTIITVWALAAVLGAFFAATLVGIPVTLGLLAAALLFQQKVTAARTKLDEAAARRAQRIFSADTLRLTTKFDKPGDR